jgi:hypothetical protein
MNNVKNRTINEEAIENSENWAILGLFLAHIGSKSRLSITF